MRGPFDNVNESEMRLTYQLGFLIRTLAGHTVVILSENGILNEALFSENSIELKQTEYLKQRMGGTKRFEKASFNMEPKYALEGIEVVLTVGNKAISKLLSITKKGEASCTLKGQVPQVAFVLTINSMEVADTTLQDVEILPHKKTAHVWVRGTKDAPNIVTTDPGYARFGSKGFVESMLGLPNICNVLAFSVVLLNSGFENEISTKHLPGSISFLNTKTIVSLEIMMQDSLTDSHTLAVQVWWLGMKLAPRTVTELPTYATAETDVITGSPRISSASDADEFNTNSLLTTSATLHFLALGTIPTKNVNLFGEETLHAPQGIPHIDTEQFCLSKEGRKNWPVAVIVLPEYATGGKNGDTIANDGGGHIWRIAFVVET
jgi:hypothetical protein